ncbi:MAG: glucosamine-6-phosphate deaminase [Clostridiaceae bacterium]
MNIIIEENAELLGKKASEIISKAIREAIIEKGSARILLATGASQLSTYTQLIKEDIEWGNVEMFHLDEYIGLPMTHVASFRKYLKERFVDLVHPKNANFISGEGNITENIRILTEELRKSTIDVALIGIGENGHIAFNDPPADFETDESYICVTLDERCKLQQVGEGWFSSLDEVPNEAITMSVKEIMRSKKIVSIVPHQVKATAVRDTLKGEIGPMIPASILRSHQDWTLLLDVESASLL